VAFPSACTAAGRRAAHAHGRSLLSLLPPSLLLLPPLLLLPLLPLLPLLLLLLLRNKPLLLLLPLLPLLPLLLLRNKPLLLLLPLSLSVPCHRSPYARRMAASSIVTSVSSRDHPESRA
jgi:hypothetical protein